MLDPALHELTEAHPEIYLIVNGPSSIEMLI